MSNNETANYNCSQQELYTIGQLGWKNCENNLARFTAFSPRYTAEYCANCRGEIRTAKALPSDNARSGLSEDNRILLMEAAQQGMLKWQSLKRYISDAYNDKRVDTMLKIAGQPFYTDASHYSWQAVSSLLDEGASFITNHLDDLLANDNMPETFIDDYNATKDNFENLQSIFLGGVSSTSTNAQNKVKANNGVYAKLMKMMGDAQIIFANDETTKQDFIFSNLKSMVSGINAAGIRGNITAASTGLPIANAAVATANNIYTTLTDVEGHFELKGMAADDYSITVMAEGFVSQTLAVTVKTGTMSGINLVLDVTPPTV